MAVAIAQIAILRRWHFISNRVNKQLPSGCFPNFQLQPANPFDRHRRRRSPHTRSDNLFSSQWRHLLLVGCGAAIPFMLPMEVFMGSTLATLHIHVKRRQKD